MDGQKTISEAQRNLAGNIVGSLESINDMSILRGDELEIPNVSIPDYWRARLDEVRGWEKVAVLAGQRSFSYRTLDQEADRILAACRRDWRLQNVTEDCVVAIHIPPSFERIAALMAVLKMGCAYMPLEDTLPLERIRLMIVETGATFIITTTKLAETFKAKDFRDLHLNILEYAGIEDKNVEPKEKMTNNTGDELKGDHQETSGSEGNEVIVNANTDHSNKLVAVLYTSGTTGVPKGVKLRTGNVMNRLFWYWKAFPFGEKEIGCHKTSFLFVDSLTEILACVLHGAPLLVLSVEQARHPYQLLGAVSKHQVTRLVLVPSLLHALLDICETDDSFEPLRHLRLVMSGGEPLSVGLAKRFFALAPGACVLANFYGSTETTGDVAVEVFVDESDVDNLQVDNSVSVGAPVWNTSVMILSSEQEPVREGELGVVYVSGLNVADGYVNKGPKLLFIDNTCDNRQGHERLFNTGDFGLIKGGKLFLFGRVDDTINVRGHRVNMLEIWNVVDKIHSIQKQVVLPCQIGDQTLPVCFCQLEKGSNAVKEDIIQILRGVLPNYMVPRIVMVENIPSQPTTGKIDRQALRNLFYANLAGSVSAKDASPTEIILNTVARNLGIRPADIKSGDSFIALGGNSLSAVSTVVELKRMGYFAPIDQFLQVTDFSKFSEDLASIEGNMYEPMIGMSSDLRKYAVEQVSSLQEEDTTQAIDLLANEFSKRGPLEVLANITPQVFKKFVMSIWHNVFRDDLSFVVRDTSNGKITAVSVILDAGTHINVGLVMVETGAILEEAEVPVKEVLLQGGGHWADALMVAIDSGLPADETLVLLQLMEEETLKVAGRRGFDGIITINVHPVTMGVDEHYFGYTVENEIHVKSWEYQGRTPFEDADDDYVIKTMVKRLT